MRRFAGGRSVTSSSPIRIRPLDACSRPAIRRNVVDLPHPDGPSSTRKDPASASKLTLSTAAVTPHNLLTLRTVICDTAFTHSFRSLFRHCVTDHRPMTIVLQRLGPLSSGDRSSECPLLALTGQSNCVRVCPHLLEGNNG